MAKIRLVAVGGNSELTAGAKSSLRGMSAGANGGELSGILFPGREVECTYFAWTGTPRENDWWVPVPPMHLNGANRVVDALGISRGAGPLVIVGWSNGGDTAYNIARKLGADRAVDALITLDPVSRLSSTHWLPFVGPFGKPGGVKHWFHAFTASAKFVDRLNPGNIIAAVGGAWDSQPNADFNVCVSGNHGHTREMLHAITGSEPYLDFRATL